MNLHLTFARKYVEAGLSVFPASKQTKIPTLDTWKVYQERWPTPDELAKMFNHSNANTAIAIVCGEVSGNLEVLDFDFQAEKFEEWRKLVDEEAPGLVKRLCISRTQSGGRHIKYRCPDATIPGNSKLAERLVGDKPKALIETRGEGGYFLAAPTVDYEVIQGDLLNLPIITPEERKILISAALSLNEYVNPQKIEGQGHRIPRETQRPGDDFNKRGKVAPVLEKHGWQSVGERGSYLHYRRPGKERGTSASLIEGRIFYNFSANGDPFEMGTAYSPFAVYSILEHAGDYSAAACVLSKEGYGEPMAGGVSGGTDWPDPEPLRRTPAPGEPFPVEALGATLGEAASAIQSNIKAPLAVCGQSVLSVANLAAQGHADVSIHGRKFPISEFFITIAQSGDRKSAADRAALVPVDEHQKYLLENYQKDWKRYETEVALWKRDREDVLKDKDSLSRRAGLEAMPSEPTPPPYPLLTTEEPTYEGLIKLLAIGWPSVGLFSDEAGRFFGGHAMSQEHRLKTLAGLSALWDGRPITRTRGGDGSMTLYGRRCCAHFLMQPLVAETILGDPLAHDQGFMSRCLIVAPESTLGKQTYSPKDLTEEAAYRLCRSRVSEILQAKLPLKSDPKTGKFTYEMIPRNLLVAPDAMEVWIGFHDWVQGHLRLDGIFQPISGIAAKAAEHALRLAGTLALVDHLNIPAITLEHVKNGITLARFYLTEALRIFHSARTNPDLLIAEKVLAWLRTREGTEENLIALPEVYQFGPNAVRDKATATKIMQLLQDHLWVKSVEGGAEVGGKKRRQVWEVSPHVFQGSKFKF